MAESTELRRLKRQLLDVQSELSQLRMQVVTNKSRTEWDLDDQAYRLQRLEEKAERSRSPAPRIRLSERSFDLSLTVANVLIGLSLGFAIGVTLVRVTGYSA